MSENIEQLFGKVIAEFPVLYAGWELDGKGYVVRADDGTVKLVMTSHGTPHEADPDDVEEKIREYEAAITSSRAALALLAVEPSHP